MYYIVCIVYMYYLLYDTTALHSGGMQNYGFPARQLQISDRTFHTGPVLLIRHYIHWLFS